MASRARRYFTEPQIVDVPSNGKTTDGTFWSTDGYAIVQGKHGAEYHPKSKFVISIKGGGQFYFPFDNGKIIRKDGVPDIKKIIDNKVVPFTPSEWDTYKKELYLHNQPGALKLSGTVVPLKEFDDAFQSFTALALTANLPTPLVKSIRPPANLKTQHAASGHPYKNEAANERSRKQRQERQERQEKGGDWKDRILHNRSF